MIETLLKSKIEVANQARKKKRAVESFANVDEKREQKHDAPSEPNMPTEFTCNTRE